MNETIYEGETLEQALSKAAEALSTVPEDLEYEVTEESDGGFWGLDDIFVHLRAWPRAEDEEAGGSSPEEADKNEAEPAPEPEEPASTTTAPVDPAPPLPAKVDTEPSETGGAELGGFWGSSDAASEKIPAGDGEDGENATADREADELRGLEAAPASEGPVARDDDLDDAKAPAAEDKPAAGEARGDEGSALEEQSEEHTGAASEAVAAAAGAAEDTDGDASPEIESLVKKILVGMGFDCTIDLQAEAEAYTVMVGGTDKELLLEGNGRPLSALELILNHAFRHRLTERRKIRVDAGDFRSRREDELRDLAFQVAHSAKETERTQETQPLNPYERRLVHLALAEDSAVTTRSRGSGFLKNVQVIPRRSGRGNR